MRLHETTFGYLKPTDEQLEIMDGLRTAAKNYATLLDETLEEGPDKDHILQRVRETAMWVNVCVTREADGTPRS